MGIKEFFKDLWRTGWMPTPTTGDDVTPPQAMIDAAPESLPLNSRRWRVKTMTFRAGDVAVGDVNADKAVNDFCARHRVVNVTNSQHGLFLVYRITYLK